ncbi:MAG: hypothetical protein L6302_01790 [Desulfobacteraceae bacterium]|nr:hypothetical protein [Desulfobacteraceae bacterium]
MKKKKLYYFLFILVLTFSGSSPLYAGGIDNKQCFSSEYLRTFSRNAATDSADAVAYNPAGVMKLDDGLYVNLNILHIFKEYTNTIDDVDYASDEPSTIPSMFGLYRQDRWAIFTAYTIPGGGGMVEYKNGNATTHDIATGIINSSGGAFSTIKSHYLKSDSYYYGYTMGGACDLNDMISVSLGARYIDAQKKSKGLATLSGVAPDKTYYINYEENADGWGAFAGINLSLSKKLNIGLKYETKTKLDFKTKAHRLDVAVVTDGEKIRRDLPALLATGISYNFTPDLKAQASFTYYFEKNADWEDRPTTTLDESKGGNSYDLAIAFEYTFKPGLRGSIGYMYSNTGIKADDMVPEEPQLDAGTICAGAAYEAIPGLDINIAVMKSFFDKEKTSAGVEYDKDVFSIALGIQYNFN